MGVKSRIYHAKERECYVSFGQVVFLGDLLGAQMLLYGNRIVASTLYRGVVGHHQALSTEMRIALIFVSIKTC